MVPFTPVTWSGDNLGQRHRHLNSLVRQAAETDVESLAEHSPVDRLFKIDLAVQQRHLPYIVHNLKDDDVLFVSRALKAKWLVDHRDIINPKYLEDVLFPQMVTPAVTKMKHWLYINLRVPAMCQEFYQYYKQNTFELAIKFLSHCSHEFILEEVPNILTKLTTHYLKVLCEKCPTVAKIYFDALSSDEDLRGRYLEQEQSYYNSVKCVLKSDANIFLDITEKYFNPDSFKRLSPSATDYILRHHKTRFTNKLELYAVFVLHIPTLADRLSVEECQEVVIRLARASYLKHKFEYKLVEPLIKRLRPDKRAAFKKLVFVEKNIGELVDNWSYETPSSPIRPDCGPHVFDDDEYMPICVYSCFKRKLKKKKCALWGNYEIPCCEKIKSELDRLFDEFRFVGFDKTLHDLAQRLGVAGSADRRRDIFLVLVSKSGGRSDAVAALLRVAARHSNEPAHTRAAVLRSLVKRANVWRLPEDVWQHLLTFGHGLGLNGATPEAACPEGLHAVVIRQLLLSGLCEPAVWTAFLNDFSTLAEYSLLVEERTRVANGLQNMLSVAATEQDPKLAAQYLNLLLDVIEKYQIGVGPSSLLVEAVKNLALRHADIALPLLERLYNARIARRELMRLNLKFRCDHVSFINVLRHDPSAFDLEQLTDILATGKSRFDNFISKLVIYFNQEGDFTINLKYALKEKISRKQIVTPVRPFVSLLGKKLEDELREVDTVGKENVKFAAALRACAHRARPRLDLMKWGWRKAGVKVVATQAMRCREADRAEITRALASDRRTVKVALALCTRSAGGLLLDTLVTAAKLRPAVALRVALLHFRRYGASADVRVWNILKPLLFSVDLTTSGKLILLLVDTKRIPSTIKPDYCACLYFMAEKDSCFNPKNRLRDFSTLVSDINDETMETILFRLLERKSEEAFLPTIPCPAIFVRYLMLARNEDDFEKRFSRIGNLFLEGLDSLVSEENFQKRLDQILSSLKYNTAFFDTKYTSCLSVIERILTWLQKFLPKEEYFDKYVHIHLTMLYCKAVQQCVKQMPQVFADPKRKRSEGVEAVGFVFGRYIAKEVAQLVSTYFESIMEIYTSALSEYLGKHFTIGRSRKKFFGFVLKGILAEGVGSQRRVVVYFLRDRGYDMEDSIRKEIVEQLALDKDVEFYVHAELLNCSTPNSNEVIIDYSFGRYLAEIHDS